MKNHFPMLVRFNGWANEQIYGTCSELPEQAYQLDRKAFFGSISNTLNHLLVVDRLWLGRLQRTEHGIRGLDQILYDDFDSLRSARIAEDHHLIDQVDSLDEIKLSEVITYRLMNGRKAKTPVHLILVTLFNHHTHHRGQVHTMLTQAGLSPPDTDVIDYLDPVV